LRTILGSHFFLAWRYDLKNRDVASASFFSNFSGPANKSLIIDAKNDNLLCLRGKIPLEIAESNPDSKEFLRC